MGYYGFWDRSNARYKARTRLREAGLDADLHKILGTSDIFHIDRLQEDVTSNVRNLLEALSGPNCVAIYKALKAREHEQAETADT